MGAVASCFGTKNKVWTIEEIANHTNDLSKACNDLDKYLDSLLRDNYRRLGEICCVIRAFERLNNPALVYKGMCRDVYEAKAKEVAAVVVALRGHKASVDHINASLRYVRMQYQLAAPLDQMRRMASGQSRYIIENSVLVTSEFRTIVVHIDEIWNSLRELAGDLSDLRDKVDDAYTDNVKLEDDTVKEVMRMIAEKQSNELALDPESPDNAELAIEHDPVPVSELVEHAPIPEPVEHAPVPVAVEA
jgi:hypothetical protein